MSRGAFAVEGGDPNSAASPDAARRPRLLVVGSHVVQYAASAFRQMVLDSRVDLRVAYCSMQGAEAGVDPVWGA